MTAFIDMQGFKGLNNKFIVKEIAVLYKDNTYQHFILYPPFNLQTLSIELQRQASWLYQNYHGLSWDGGNTSLEEALKDISTKLHNHTTIYVKHLEKEQWLNELFTDNNNKTIKQMKIINLDTFDCPNIQILKKTYPLYHCLLHRGCCAFQNIFLFYHFLINHN